MQLVPSLSLPCNTHINSVKFKIVIFRVFKYTFSPSIQQIKCDVNCYVHYLLVSIVALAESYIYYIKHSC